MDFNKSVIVLELGNLKHKTFFVAGVMVYRDVQMDDQTNM